MARICVLLLDAVAVVVVVVNYYFPIDIPINARMNDIKACLILLQIK